MCEEFYIEGRKLAADERESHDVHHLLKGVFSVFSVYPSSQRFFEFFEILERDLRERERESRDFITKLKIQFIPFIIVVI